MRINLGCCDDIRPGYLNVDVCPPCDQIVDLTVAPWPWPDSSVDEIVARDVIEHLPDTRQTMAEAWRVLKPGGIFRVQVPDCSEGDGGKCDPTHVSEWNRSSFEYFYPGIAERERFRQNTYYGIKADFVITNLDENGHIRRQRYERKLGGFVYEMTVVLEAVK